MGSVDLNDDSSSADFPGEDPNDSTPVSADSVVDVAVEEFSRHGYTDTKLETIATVSGMSKRMIHYHFGDKRGLYIQALGRAINSMHPPADELRLDTSVPVEGVRKLVDAMYRQFVAHPESIRLIVMDNLNGHSTLDEIASVANQSQMTLYMDRLLMLGQDSGAFRPGISSDDLYTLIASIIYYRQVNHALTLKLFKLDMRDEDNTDGMHRMLVDTVLAFLTSNIPDSGKASYLAAQLTDEGTDSPNPIYDEDSSLGDGLFLDEE